MGVERGQMPPSPPENYPYTPNRILSYVLVAHLKHSCGIYLKLYIYIYLIFPH
jgi:hypothetical protein